MPIKLLECLPAFYHDPVSLHQSRESVFQACNMEVPANAVA